MPQQSFFRTGLSIHLKAGILVLISLILLGADQKYELVKYTRKVLGSIFYPIEYVVSSPFMWFDDSVKFVKFANEQKEKQAIWESKQLENNQKLLTWQALQQENYQLRTQLELQKNSPKEAVVAEIILQSPDPFIKKVILNKGFSDKIHEGQPVIDAQGVVGQISRSYANHSELTLLTDKNQGIPVVNLRTGQRTIAFGNPRQQGLELRFIANNSDLQHQDVMLTSGLDGIYPSGLPVCQVQKQNTKTDSNTLQNIACVPLGGVEKSKYVTVLLINSQMPTELLQLMNQPTAPIETNKIANNLNSNNLKNANISNPSNISNEKMNTKQSTNITPEIPLEVTTVVAPSK
jgi:rod shape-determining protein MreC